MIFQITNPSLFQPVYNTSYQVVNSNDYPFFPVFRFVFDIFTTYGGTTQYLGRYKLLPRPNNQCQFSPNRVLESVFHSDLTHNTIAIMPSSGICRQYTVYQGEEINGVTTSGLTSMSGYCIGAVSNYQLLPSWNYNDYWTKFYLTANTNSFLTNQPSSIYIRDNERASISFMDYFKVGGGGSAVVPDNLRIRVYHISGGSTAFGITNTACTLSNSDSNFIINHLGSGIWNINNIPNALFFLGAQPVFNSLTDYKYDITFEDSNTSTLVTKTQTYVLDTRCTKYQPIRFIFRNPYGCMDYFTALLVSRQTLNINRTTYEKVLPYNYSVGDRGSQITDIDAQESVTVTTDWVSDLESQWLRDFFLSQEVYQLNDDGSILPIIIQNNTVEILKSINDKLINYQFDFIYAYKLGTQRG